MDNYMFRPVLTIFRLSQGNLRTYYKHAHARGVEISYMMNNYMFRRVHAYSRFLSFPYKT